MLHTICLIAGSSVFALITQAPVAPKHSCELQAVTLLGHGQQALATPFWQAQAGPVVADGPEPQPPPVPLARPVIRVADGPEPQPPPVPLARPDVA